MLPMSALVSPINLKNIQIYQLKSWPDSGDCTAFSHCIEALIKCTEQISDSGELKV